jgi:NAD(P)-dependent dehydrogenase (short-subunit alcohol dehydrogenase family)
VVPAASDKEVVRRLARQGMSVVIADRDAPAAAELAAELGAAGHDAEAYKVPWQVLGREAVVVDADVDRVHVTGLHPGVGQGAGDDGPHEFGGTGGSSFRNSECSQPMIDGASTDAVPGDDIPDSLSMVRNRAACPRRVELPVGLCRGRMKLSQQSVGRGQNSTDK